MDCGVFIWGRERETRSRVKCSINLPAAPQELHWCRKFDLEALSAHGPSGTTVNQTGKMCISTEPIKTSLCYKWPCVRGENVCMCVRVSVTYNVSSKCALKDSKTSNQLQLDVTTCLHFIIPIHNNPVYILMRCILY